MKKKKKNLLMYFMELTSSDNGCTKQRDKVMKLIAKVQNDLGIQEGTKGVRPFMELENEVVKLFQMTRENYFKYGMVANDIDENYNLEDEEEKVIDVKKIA